MAVSDRQAITAATGDTLVTVALAPPWQQFQTLVEHTPDVIARFDRDLRHVYVNPAVERVTGIPVAAFIGRTNADLGMPPALMAEWNAPVLGVFVTGKETDFAFSFPGAGGIRHYHARAVPECDAEGAVTSVLVISRDVTALTETEIALRESERIHRLLIEAAPVGACILDAEGRHETVNAAYCALYGYLATELIGHPFTMVLPTGAHATMLRRHHAVLRGIERREGDFEIFTRTGSRRTVRTSTVPFRDSAGRAHRAVYVQDITDHLLTVERLASLASHDALTGLPNRARFDERLREEITLAPAGGARVGVLFLDFDGFKAVNDTHGHEMGDVALLDIAARLRELVRTGDTVARYGGDEFLIALPGVADADEVLRLAERIVRAFADGVTILGTAMSLGVSVGVALYPDDGEEAGALVACADRAMYAAKQSGKGRAMRSSGGPDRSSSPSLRAQDR